MKSTLVICFVAIAAVTQMTDANGCSYLCSSRHCSTSWWRTRCTTKYRMCSCTHCEFGEFKLQSCGGCSRNCGGGEMTCKYKREIAVHASSRGNPCNMADATKTEKRSCNTHHCPVHCKWGPFTKQTKCTQCSATCEEGKRKCEWRRNVAVHAQYGGTPCSGISSEMREENCNHGPCPIDCEWGPFTKQKKCTPCSVTCEEGNKKCEWRRNIAIKAQYGGKQCSGSATEMREEICKLDPCPIDGGWSDWSAYSECSENCDKTRRRTCTNPPPQYGGKYCEGREKETINCFEGLCLAAACRKITNEDFHVGLPGSCVKFVKCNKATDEHGVFDCEKGTVWSDEANSCILSTDDTHCGRVVGNDRSVVKESCKNGEMVAATGKCDMYRMCVHGAFIDMPCPATLYFNPETNRCDSRNKDICTI